MAAPGSNGSKERQKAEHHHQQEHPLSEEFPGVVLETHHEVVDDLEQTDRDDHKRNVHDSLGDSISCRTSVRKAFVSGNDRSAKERRLDF